MTENAHLGAGEGVVRSARFRDEREANWRRLETLLKRMRAKGRAALTSRELMELPHLYRATLSSLSIARSYVLDTNLVNYLDALTARAHAAVFASRESLGGALWRILARDLPRSVRYLAWPILLAGAVLLLGILVGRAIVIERPDLFESLVSTQMAQGRNPFATTEFLRKSLAGHPASLADFQAFALRLIQNNVMVSMLALAMGLALGIPTALILFYNGVIVGAIIAVYALRGLEMEMIAWLSIHGTTELLAIILAGGAGFAIGGALMFPGERQSRLASAGAIGPHVARIAIAIFGLLLIAGFLESFGRGLIEDMPGRFSIGFGFAAIWLLYFTRAGR